MRSGFRVNRPVPYAILAAVAFASVGCGGKAKVSGTVELDGKPVQSGNIVFIPSSGPAVSAPIKNGQYTAEGVPTGDVRVTIENVEAKRLVENSKPKTSVKGGGPAGFMKGPPKVNDTEVAIKPRGKEAAFDEMPPGAREALQKQMQTSEEGRRVSQEMIDNYRPIPEKYNSPDTSGLGLKVKSGSNTYNVTMSSQ
jgi:hypothetical protein